jgi:membrane protease YdiL (CAAX protease family)
VLTYFVLTFAISWGGFVLVVGPGSFPGTGSQFDTITPYVVVAMLAGPTISGLLLTGLVSGRAGYRELLSRLLRWRVGARWYAVALLIAPLLAWALLAVFSLTPPVFTTGDKAAFVLTGVVAGLVGGLFEELGWTGFAVPRLRLRHGILATGLIVGIPWGAWHLLQGLWIGGTYAGTVPLGLFLVLNFLSGIAELTAFRILMMWVYDRTESLLIVALMHASLITGTIFLFTPMATGMLGLAYAWSLNAALWLLVGVVVAANHGHLARQPFARPVI